MFNCRDCNMLLEWPENWQKGNRPIEAELHKEHTRERCSEIANPHSKKPSGFTWCGVKDCPQCLALYGRKYYKLPSVGDMVRI